MPAERPLRTCNLVVFRENTEGVYVGIGGQFKKGTPDEVAIKRGPKHAQGRRAHDPRGLRLRRDERPQARAHERQVERDAPTRTASGSGCSSEVASGVPERRGKHLYVDALAMEMVRAPESGTRSIVTNNLFGDIVTDLGAALQGGLGMAASANVRPDDARWTNVKARCRGLFEPVHGSAPDIAGKDLANPLATVLTVGMMLTHLGIEGEEAKLTQLVKDAVAAGMTTRDLGGDKKTSEVGRWVIDRV
jgi:3-isopropylmalate dehydrogenase